MQDADAYIHELAQHLDVRTAMPRIDFSDISKAPRIAPWDLLM